MAKLILFEGTSGSYKTSIVKSLASQLSIPTIGLNSAHKPDLPVAQLPAYYSGACEAFMDTMNNIDYGIYLLDRSLLSELVYSRIMARKSYVSVAKVAKFLRRHEVTIVYTYTDYADYLNRYDKKKDKSAYTEIQHKLIKHTYRDLFNTLHDHQACKLIHMADTTGISWASHCMQMLELINSLLTAKDYGYIQHK